MTATAILSVAVAGGGFEPLLDMAAKRFAQYANVYGYDTHFQRPEPLGDRGPAWTKIPAMLALLKDYDNVLLLDCDTVPSLECPPFPFDDMRDAGRSMALVEQEVPWPGEGFVPNTGVWGVTKGAIPLLEEIWDFPLYHNSPWFEQSAYMGVVGYTMTKPHPPLPPANWEAHGVMPLAPEWNALKDHDFGQSAYIRHASGLGITMEWRTRLMEEWLCVS